MTVWTFNKTGWIASFDGEKSGGIAMLDIEAWSDSGAALVVDKEIGALVPAHSRPGFQRLEQCKRIAAVLPADPGWRVLDTSTKNEFYRDTAVVGWAVDDDGAAHPLRAGEDELFVEEIEPPKQLLLSPHDHAVPGDGAANQN